MNHLSQFALRALAVLAVAATPLFAAEPDLDALRQRLPEQVTPLTIEQLASKVPNFYYFDYPHRPEPGKRYWLRVEDSTWIERYPSGLQSTYKVLGHATVKGTGGTIVVKISGDPKRTGTDNAGGLLAFIPDKGSKTMHHWYRNLARGDRDWKDLAEMKSVE